MKFKVLQIVFLLQVTRVAQAGLADVDACHAGIGLAQGVSGCLRSTATGNEDLQVFSKWLGGPYQMKLSSTTLRVFVQITVFIQTCEWRRIRHPFIKGLDLFGGGAQRVGLLGAVHF